MHQSVLAVLLLPFVIGTPARAQESNSPRAQELRAAWAPSKPVAHPVEVSAPAADEVDPDTTPGFRTVTASPRSLFHINTKLRITTMIVLPDGDTIVDVIAGDPVFWTITTSDNIANIKPNEAKKETNVNFITASGTVHSFMLHEGKDKDGKPITVPDLRVQVLAPPTQLVAPPKKYYTAAQYDALQAELLVARQQIQAAKTAADEQIETFKRAFPTSLKFDYAPWINAEPFLVRAIWHDDQFTYLRVDGKKKPSLFEIVDGEPSALNYQVENSIYVVPKVLDRGYLAIGKARFNFSRQ